MSDGPPSIWCVVRGSAEPKFFNLSFSMTVKRNNIRQVQRIREFDNIKPCISDTAFVRKVHRCVHTVRPANLNATVAAESRLRVCSEKHRERVESWEAV